MQEPIHPGHDDIAALAYEIWERNGRPAGREIEFWLRAEQLLLSHSNPQPQAAPPPALTAAPPQDKPAAAKPPGPRSKKPASRPPKGAPAPARQPAEYVRIAKPPFGGVRTPGF